MVLWFLSREGGQCRYLGCSFELLNLTKEPALVVIMILRVSWRLGHLTMSAASIPTKFSVSSLYTKSVITNLASVPF